MSIQVTENELQCVQDNGVPVLRCKTRNELEAKIESLEKELAEKEAFIDRLRHNPLFQDRRRRSYLTESWG